MNIQSKKYIFKLSGLILLGLLFSTNYYGGNSLFFLTDDTLFLLRVFLGIFGTTAFVTYLILNKKDKLNLTKHNNRYYAQKAVQQMDNFGLNYENIDTALKNGKKNRGRLNTIYSYYMDETGHFSVVENQDGYIVSVTAVRLGKSEKV